MSDISGLPARRAALQMIDAVLHRGETLETVERNALRRIRGPADQALARAIAGETLRWLTDLDMMIDSAMKKPLPHDAKPRSVLRLMLAQWLRLDTPPHAVIATALPLLTGGPRRLAHGVFSTLNKRDGLVLPDIPTLAPEVEFRWGDRADAIAAGIVTPPPLDLALKDWSQTEERAEAMGGISLAPGHIRLPRGTPIDQLPSYKDGDWWVQDLAATLPARLLGPGAGKRVLDLCAAPGGKTMQLAAAGWNVTALDISERRLDRVRQNLERTGLQAEIIKANALTWRPAKQFDAILLDAPCTATGTCRRHPDVVHRIGERQIEEQAELQNALLERAVEWLPEGSTLIYAVCSLESSEGEAQAESVNLAPVPITSEELPGGLEPTKDGWLKTDPGMLADAGGLDGFFVGRWRK
ncbi:transcription antitermination factor NusB [Pontixanthobacter aestiaquae]|uniref:Methyltransferase domain-containing protein n=1 Tax=Pontixanthobacter aestiaquae TaxID=1509367 RepID=A0A844Z8Y5_9SPHN|nr:transcription antitermination factor NusB [Pontixanthobacter aestiaquae]MDN3644608.1 transcription antitermination factor NusB [Pontixanthobacter aestiaquae]MXO84385.1 methyltransferase domain-containing protein [Pontixanthobacter aestiaquae]